MRVLVVLRAGFGVPGGERRGARRVVAWVLKPEGLESGDGPGLPDGHAMV
jgi:hypothetical protein